MYNRILVCDVGGTPHHWANYKDAVKLKVKNRISAEFGYDDTYHGGLSRLTFLQSEVDVGPILFLKRTLKYDARVPQLTNQNLFARDLNICGFCGRHYTESKLSRDHVVPTSKGGLNTWTNCVTACRSCNHAKGNKYMKDAGMELLYVPYIPSHVERLIMANKNILADQMDFLKAMLPRAFKNFVSTWDSWIRVKREVTRIPHKSPL